MIFEKLACEARLGYGFSGMAQAEKRERLTFIDLMRGYAILMMLMGHTIHVVMADPWRDEKYPAYVVWHYLTGLTAPTFLFSAGFIFAYLLARGKTKGGQRVEKGLKRSGSLMILGWVFHLKPDFFKGLFGGDFSVVGDLLGHSSVLHVIGLSILMLIGLWLVSGQVGKRFVLVALIVGQAAFLLGPFLADWEGSYPVWLRPVEIFVSGQKAYFPLFPWSGYVFLGAALGGWAWEAKWYRELKWFGVLIPLGILMKWVMTGPVPEGSQGFYWRAGEVLILLALIGALCFALQKKGWDESWPVQVVARCGQETLTMFCLHNVVLYGVWTGFGLSHWCGKQLGPWQTVMAIVVMEACFIALALNLPKLRQVFPPLRLLR